MIDYNKKRILRIIPLKIQEYLKKRNLHNAYFDISDDCNLKCKHCYYNRGKKREELNIEEWKELFIKTKEKGYRNAALSGGEPTLRPDIINLAKKTFDEIMIFTNGSNKIDIDARIFLSIDGPKKIHDNIRGKGSFETLFKNYSNDKRVIGRMCINKINKDFIEDTVQTAKRMNIYGMGFVFYLIENEDDLSLDENELVICENKILKLMKKYPKFILSSEKILNSMISGDFRKACEMRKVPSYFADGTKKKCPIHYVNCATCRCSTAALMHNSLKDLKSLKISLKFQ